MLEDRAKKKQLDSQQPEEEQESSLTMQNYCDFENFSNAMATHVPRAPPQLHSKLFQVYVAKLAGS